jgi:rare lipoprotein A
VLAGLMAAGCTPQGVPPHPHYVLGAAYQADGVWHYPRRRLNGVMTGLAAVIPPGHPPLTADGEAFDPEALAAASPNLQLPAIVRLTNLANGRQLEVRINDRGPADPGRLIAVTARVAALLGIAADGAAPVRLHVLAGPSQTAEAALPGAPLLAMKAAPVGAVVTRALGAPGRTAVDPVVASAATPLAPAVGGAPGGVAGGDNVPALSGQVTQGRPTGGNLWVRLGRFTQYEYAAQLAARVAGLHPVIRREIANREEHFIVGIGPFGFGAAGIAAADAALHGVIGVGIGGARIVVEQE